MDITVFIRDFFIILLKLKIQMGGCFDKIDGQIPTQLGNKKQEIEPSQGLVEVIKKQDQGIEQGGYEGLNEEYEDSLGQEGCIHQVYFGKLKPQRVTSQDRNNAAFHRHITVIYGKNTMYRLHGSGLLISKNLILTCAHNFYHNNVKELDKKCYNLYPGHIDGKLYMEKSYKIESLYIPQNYKKLPFSSQFDYALIKLDRQVQQVAGTDLLPLNGSFEKKENQQFYIFGYPSSACQNLGSNAELFQQMGLKVDSNDIEIEVDNEKALITHKISTQGGQSGCPIIVRENGKYSVVGIHKGARQNLKKNIQPINTARLITKQLIQELRQQAIKWGAHMFRVYGEDEVVDSVDIKVQLVQEQSMKNSKEQLAQKQISKPSTNKLDLNYKQQPQSIQNQEEKVPANQKKEPKGELNPFPYQKKGGLGKNVSQAKLHYQNLARKVSQAVLPELLPKYKVGKDDVRLLNEGISLSQGHNSAPRLYQDQHVQQREFQIQLHSPQYRGFSIFNFRKSADAQIQLL